MVLITYNVWLYTGGSQPPPYHIAAAMSKHALDFSNLHRPPLLPSQQPGASAEAEDEHYYENQVTDSVHSSNKKIRQLNMLYYLSLGRRFGSKTTAIRRDRLAKCCVFFKKSSFCFSFGFAARSFLLKGIGGGFEDNSEKNK